MYCFDGVYFNGTRLEDLYSVWFHSSGTQIKVYPIGGEPIIIDDTNALDFSIRDIKRGSSFRVSWTDIPCKAFHNTKSSSVWYLEGSSFTDTTDIEWIDPADFVRDDIKSTYTVVSEDTVKLFDYINSSYWGVCADLFEGIFAFSDLHVSVDDNVVSVPSLKFDNRIRLNNGAEKNFKRFIFKLKITNKSWVGRSYVDYLRNIGLWVW